MAALASGSPAPAQLGFLAIYNPSLGNSDDTLDDQIVYYASVTARTRGRPTEATSQEERNERLRQIGLAQGMVSFSQGFADGSAVDSIETETSRVIVHELESGWWILAVCENMNERDERNRTGKTRRGLFSLPIYKQSTNQPHRVLI